jgi:hypothetical protein
MSVLSWLIGPCTDLKGADYDPTESSVWADNIFSFEDTLSCISLFSWFVLGYVQGEQNPVHFVEHKQL